MSTLAHRRSSAFQRSAKKVFRQVDETEAAEKMPLFSESENGYLVSLFAGMGSAGVALGSTLTAIFGAFPLVGILATDAGIAGVGTAATIFIAQKMNYSLLQGKFLFKNGKPKVKILLPGQVHVEKTETFFIDETQHSRSKGYYSHKLRNSVDSSSSLTHEVETVIVQKWNGSTILQKVTPLAEYVWDDTFESALDVHEIAPMNINTGKSSLAVQAVKNKSRSMAERIREIEESTATKELAGTRND